MKSPAIQQEIIAQVFDDLEQRWSGSFSKDPIIHLKKKGVL